MAKVIEEHVKDPGSAITHFIGMLMAIFAAIPLLIKAAHEPGRIYLVSIAVYAVSLILLYAASTTYHTFNISKKVNTILKKIDHMMISVLIAGSYTPICLLVLGGRMGWILLAIVWGFAIAGILIKAFWVFCPKWVSSVLYIGMGWTCVLAFTQLLNSLSPAAFGWPWGRTGFGTWCGALCWALRRAACARRGCGRRNTRLQACGTAAHRGRRAARP